MISVSFNGTDMYQAKRIVLENFTIAMPEAKIIKVSIPGRDGDLDMSEALTGFVNYHNRSIVLQFGITGSEVECESKKQYVMQLVSGKEMKIRFSHLAGYFLGRCQITSITRERRHYTLEVTCDCQPFRLAETESTYVLALISGEKSLTCVNDGMPVAPTIYTTGATTLKYQSKTYNLQSGMHRLGFVFPTGHQTIKASGTGTLTIKYRKGVL